MSDELVRVERDEPIAVVFLNRPKQLNALSDDVMEALVAALVELDHDATTRCIIIGGSERVFAAGADIGMLAHTSPVEAATSARLARWDSIRQIGKPIVAAVSGYCLGGGCELAMICDVIVASESARFGQPEINLGLIPGAGGTQRLTRAVGKAVAMDVILSGRFLTAREALDFGLVSRVVATEAWLEEAKRLARDIAKQSPVALKLAKEAVNRAYEGPLRLGVEYERQAFALALSSEDAKEGMEAFLEKRLPKFTGT